MSSSGEPPPISAPDPRSPAGAPWPSEPAESYGVLRRLEWYVSATSIAPHPGLAGRIAARIAKEPPASPPRRFVAALGAGDLGAMVRTLGQSAAALLGHGRQPALVRAQALGVLLLAVIVMGGGATLGVVGANLVLSELTRPRTPDEQQLPPPSPPTTPTPSPVPSPTRKPTSSQERRTAAPDGTRADGAEATRRPRPDATATARPRKTRMPETPGPGETREPEETPEPGETGEPEETSEPGDGEGEPDDGAGGPDATPGGEESEAD